MRATWSALHRCFLFHCHRQSAERLYGQMRGRRPELAGPSIDELLFHQHAADQDGHDRNGVLRALVIEVQAQGPASELSTAILLLALWPGLDAVHGRLCREFPLDRAEHGAEITARAAIAIAKLDLTAVTRIAATLVRNIERDIRRDLIRRNVRRRAEVLWDDDLSAGAGGRVAQPCALHDWQHRLAALKPRDATFLLRMLVLGETEEEAGRALGLSHEAARKRFQRTIARLRSPQNNS